MMKLLLESGALKIWNHKTGPVFWYAAGVPGPFFLNTEDMIGKAQAADLLKKINTIIAETSDAETRAVRLNTLILAAVAGNPTYQKIIEALVDKTGAVFPIGRFDAISGGERRDWLFSIPLAKALGVRHVFLFKNKTLYCAEGVQAGENILHVADLINNAASYFDLWLPILECHHTPCIGTACVNTRGSVGVDRLTTAGYPIAALNRVDPAFFAQLAADGLITQDTREEIALFFNSPKEWARDYLMKDARLFDVPNLDVKSFERMRRFFAEDPWGLRAEHNGIFAAVGAQIAARTAMPPSP